MLGNDMTRSIPCLSFSSEIFLRFL